MSNWFITRLGKAVNVDKINTIYVKDEGRMWMVFATFGYTTTCESNGGKTEEIPTQLYASMKREECLSFVKNNFGLDLYNGEEQCKILHVE